MKALDPRSAAKPRDGDVLVEYFLAHRMFGSLPRSVLFELAGEVLHRTYRKGQHLFWPDDPASFVFLVKSGLIAVAEIDESGAERLVLTYLPGDVFGQVAMVLGCRHARAARAMVDSDLILVPQDSFLYLYHHHTELADLTIREMSEMLSRSQRIAVEATLTPITARVARFLLELSTEEAGVTGPDVHQRCLPLALSHQDLALLLGTTRETICRTLAHLERTKVIARDKGRVAVLRADELDRLAAQGPGRVQP